MCVHSVSDSGLVKNILTDYDGEGIKDDGSRPWFQSGIELTSRVTI